MKNHQRPPSARGSKDKKGPQNSSPSPVRDAMQEGRRGTVAVCQHKFERAMTVRKTNISSIARGLKMSPNTLGKVARGIAVNRSTLDRICRYLDVELEQLLPDEPDTTSERRHQLTPPDGWVVEEYLSPVLEAANGLQYRITRLRNELVRNKQARGKFYDLLFVHPHREANLREHLARHAHVCELVGKNPNIAENLDVLPLRGGGGWWVIDSWVEGKSLALEILNPTSPVRDARHAHGIGRSVLFGLQALHEKNIVFRELAPDKVWIGDGMSRVFLTDFELAKLFGGEPSVSASTWSPDYFRAPELNNYEPLSSACSQSDLFSWGRLMQWLFSGGKEHADKLPTLEEIPRSIVKLIKQCVSPFPRQRPTTAAEVLHQWNEWNIDER